MRAWDAPSTANRIAIPARTRLDTSHADPFPRLPECITRAPGSATISRIARVPCPEVIARTWRSVPTPVKDGAPLRFPGAEAGSMQPDATDVKSVIIAGCDLAPSAAGTAKWRC